MPMPLPRARAAAPERLTQTAMQRMPSFFMAKPLLSPLMRRPGPALQRQVKTHHSRRCAGSAGDLVKAGGSASALVATYRLLTGNLLCPWRDVELRNTGEARHGITHAALR